MSDTETVSKKPKVLNTIDEATITTTEQTCAHWVKRKKRFCKMTLAKGKKYCGEHEPAVILTEEATDINRIPCPLDNKHTVYKRNLHKHLKICNARQKENEPSYIQKGINAGDEPLPTEEFSEIKLNELEDAEFYAVITKIKELYQKYVAGQIDTLYAKHKLLDTELAKLEYGKEAKKHLQQAAALLGILQNEQQLVNCTSFIEFGAGKGQLAYYLAQILAQQENSQVVLLDRMSLRHKKDNKIENRSLVQRIRVDIADFCMDSLDILNNTKRNVAVSKHLCGAATDLTLRCILQTTKSTTATNFIMIALCCHHRCEWRSFVGKEFCQSNSITPREFCIITKMVGWAICGTGMSRERRRALEQQSAEPKTLTETTEMYNNKQRLTLAEREEIGFMCKRVLDHARLVYLRKNGYEANLKYYVPRDVTLENVCLLARKLT